MLYATGLRVSELVALERKAVRREADHLTIVGKGGKERLVPLNDRAKDALIGWLDSTEKEKFVFPAKGAEGHLARQVFARDLKGLASGPGCRLRRFPRTCCATPLRPTCCKTGRICGSCRCFWAMPTFQRPRFIPMFLTLICANCSKITIRCRGMLDIEGSNRHFPATLEP